MNQKPSVLALVALLALGAALPAVPARAAEPPVTAHLALPWSGVGSPLENVPGLLLVDGNLRVVCSYFGIPVIGAPSP